MRQRRAMKTARIRTQPSGGAKDFRLQNEVKMYSTMNFPSPTCVCVYVVCACGEIGKNLRQAEGYVDPCLLGLLLAHWHPGKGSVFGS